jgi:hypothetical protein
MKIMIADDREYYWQIHKLQPACAVLCWLTGLP